MSSASWKALEESECPLFQGIHGIGKKKMTFCSIMRTYSRVLIIIKLDVDTFGLDSFHKSFQ